MAPKLSKLAKTTKATVAIMAASCFRKGIPHRAAAADLAIPKIW